MALARSWSDVGSAVVCGVLCVYKWLCGVCMYMQCCVGGVLVLCVYACGVVRGCCVVVVVVVWCDVWVLCWCCVGVGWSVCVSFLSFFSFFSQLSSLSFSFSFCLPFLSSLSFLLLFSLLSSFFSFSLFHSLFPHTVLRTDQPTNFEAFCCDLAHLGTWVTVPSVPHPLPSLLLFPSTKRGLFITGIFPARNLFLLQFYINSKKSPPGEITSVAIPKQ